MPPVKTRIVKINNSHLLPKVLPRVDAIQRLGKSEVLVLDAYAGEGLVWKEVERRLPDIAFNYLRIDKKKYDGPETINGDNLKVLPSLDLASFDLIDLDAYGIPNRQLKIVAEKAPDVPVAVTCIAQRMGPVPIEVLLACGIPAEWIDMKRTGRILWTRWRVQWWDEYCARLGYGWTRREVYEDGGMLKMYGMLYKGRPTT